MNDSVTVAIPVRNGAAVLEQTLAGVRRQRLDPPRSLELLICDSGSTDASVEIARAHAARVIEIPAGEFSHGGTRNRLMDAAEGEHVAFLTQDAVPADDAWLERLLGGFALASDVGLVFGPYLPRPGASPAVARELIEWFAVFSPDGAPRIDRLGVEERGLPTRQLLGPRGFFTDANGCVARSAWREVKFRDVPYAEDHALAHDMLRAGFAKVYIPEAAVIHSHDYSGWEWLRRSFDETRAMHEVYGFDEPGRFGTALAGVRGGVSADVRWSRGRGEARTPLRIASGSLRLHSLRAVGTMLGTRAGRLPDALVRRLSLERRGR